MATTYTYDPTASLATRFAQLEQLWTDAGGSSALAPQMAAIAIAESSGNPSGVCYDYTAADGTTKCSSTPVAGGTQADVGLWGIADIHLPAGTSTAALTDPLTNAQYAVKLAGPTGAGITSNWAAEFIPGSSGAKNYAAALAAGGASVAGAVQTFVVSDTPGATGSTVYGQTLTPSPKAATAATPAATGTGGVFGPIIDAANTIALEVFLGAVAIALLSGGIILLASLDPAVRSTAMKAALT